MGVFHRIMVPLDQSPLAEQALPVALGIARRAGATLDLVSVHVLYALSDPTAGRQPFSVEEDAEFRRGEQHYLDATAERWAAAHPVPIRTAIVDGMAVDGLLERQHDQPADLIVMTSHGRGPVSRAFLGSVADHLIRRATVPVLLVPATEQPGELAEPIVNHIFVPLDGSPLAEEVLPIVAELARLVEARCILLRVIESALPWDTTRADAHAYLERTARKLRESGLRVESRVVVAHRAAEAILEQAHGQPGNLIALATHGRGGVRRLLLGSVADKVIRSSILPVLVFRPGR